MFIVPGARRKPGPVCVSSSLQMPFGQDAEKRNPLCSLYPGVSGTFCKRAKENIALLLVCLRCRVAPTGLKIVNDSC